jgi:KUP system potassium uptake protein
MNNIKKGTLGLTLGALGVVFGDIGTSPLYAFSAVFGKAGHHLAISKPNIFGIISLITWSVTLVVSIKFIGFIMRADNEGEGGIMALVARIKGSKLQANYKWAFLLLGIVGVALFYGDSTITPAISVLSAVEGLRVVAPSLSSFIIPSTLAILTILFAIQKYGTGILGRLFGPVMLLWFGVIALGGGWQVWQHPDILATLSPVTAISFFISKPALAFIAMGAVVLAITGAEALYANLGHFGRAPITRAWFFIAFPALLLCYMGEGALLIHTSGAVTNPLVLLYPAALRIPVVLIATLATIIASQSVISGAFSLTRQAVQLNFLPKMLIRHTSTKEGGQIYLPFINIVIFIIVALLVVSFGSSAKLANAYGIAVSGTLATDTILYLVIMRSEWLKPIRNVVIMSLIFMPIDLLFVTSNLPKIIRGAWFPLALGFIIFVLITTWLKGQLIVTKELRALEGPLQDFIDKIHKRQPPIPRIPGTAIYIGHHSDLAPLALHATLEDLHELHKKVVIVSVEVTTASHIPETKRAIFDDLGYNDGIIHVSLSFGFHDSLNIPETLKNVRHLNPEFDFDLKNASYFVSLSKVIPSKRHNLARWRKSLYYLMARNEINTSDYYKLPIEHTVEMRSFIKL